MDSRLKRSAGESRKNRTEQDGSRAAPEENFPVARERRRARNEFQQTVLPNIPEIPGYHLCWLATNSQYDPIHRRFSLGYMPVRADEMPGYDMYKVKEGDQSGHIMCNEMLFAWCVPLGFGLLTLSWSTGGELGSALDDRLGESCDILY